MPQPKSIIDLLSIDRITLSLGIVESDILFYSAESSPLGLLLRSSARFTTMHRDASAPSGSIPAGTPGFAEELSAIYYSKRPRHFVETWPYRCGQVTQSIWVVEIWHVTLCHTKRIFDSVNVCAYDNMLKSFFNCSHRWYAYRWKVCYPKILLPPTP